MTKLGAYFFVSLCNEIFKNVHHSVYPDPFATFDIQIV